MAVDKQITKKVLTCEIPSPYTDRIFPRDVVEKAIAKYRKIVENDNAVGVGILASDDWAAGVAIDLSKVSHLVTDIWLEGDDLFAKFKLLPTERGTIFEPIVESGHYRLALSSMGKADSNNRITELDIMSISLVPLSQDIEQLSYREQFKEIVENKNDT